VTNATEALQRAHRTRLADNLVVTTSSPFLVLLGTCKVLGAVVLLVPRRALLKEWAYAGAFFTYTGAIASHLSTGYDRGELRLLAVLTALTVLSWALRPPAAAHSAGRPPHRWPPPARLRCGRSGE
jgi:DoxX-like family